MITSLMISHILKSEKGSNVKSALIDTIKTTTIGTAGLSVTWMEWVPVLVRIIFGIMSIGYMFYKAKNEWLKYEENKKTSNS